MKVRSRLSPQAILLAQTLASRGLDVAFKADLWSSDERPISVSLTTSDIALLPAVEATMKKLDGQVGPIVSEVEAPLWNALLRTCLGRVSSVLSKVQSRFPCYSSLLIDLPVPASALEMSAASRGIDVAPGVLFATTGFLQALLEVALDQAVSIPDVLSAHMLRLAAAGRLKLERTSPSPIDIDTEWVERGRELGLSSSAMFAAFELELAPLEERHSSEMPDKERLVDEPVRRLRASALRVLLTEDRLLEEPKVESLAPEVVEVVDLSNELASISTLSRQVDWRPPESFARALSRFERAQIDRARDSSASETRRELGARRFSPGDVELSCLAAWFDQQLATGAVEAEQEALAEALLGWAGRGGNQICGNLRQLGFSDLLPSLKTMAEHVRSHADSVRSLPFYEQLVEHARDRLSAKPELFRAMVQHALTASKADREQIAAKLLREDEGKGGAPRLEVLHCLRRILPSARFASLFGAEYLAHHAFELDRAIPHELSSTERAEWAIHLYEAAGRPPELSLITVQHAQPSAREWSRTGQASALLRDANQHAARHVWSHRGAVVLHTRSAIDWAMVAEVALGQPVDVGALVKDLRTAAFDHLEGKSVDLNSRPFAEWVTLQAPPESRLGGVRCPVVPWSTRDDFDELCRLIDARLVAATPAQLAHSLLTRPLAEEDPSLVVERFQAALAKVFSQDPRGDVLTCWTQAMEGVGSLWGRAVNPASGRYPEWLTTLEPQIILEQIERLALDPSDRRALLRHVFVEDHFASSSPEKGEGSKASHRRWVSELDEEAQSALLEILIEAGALSSAAEAVLWLQAPNERRSWGHGREPHSGGALPCATASYVLMDQVLSEFLEISQQAPPIAEYGLLAYSTLLAVARPAKDEGHLPIATPDLTTFSAALSREAARRLERGELSTGAFKALFLALTGDEPSGSTDELLRAYLEHPPSGQPDSTWIANHTGARVLDPRFRLELAKKRAFEGLDLLGDDRLSAFADREASVRALDDLLREFYPMTGEASFDRDRALEDLAWRIDLPKEDLGPLIERWKTGVGRGVQPIWDRFGPSQALAIEQLGPDSLRALIRYATGHAPDFSEAGTSCREDLLTVIRDPEGVYSKIFKAHGEPKRCAVGYRIQADLLIEGIRKLIDGSPPNERVPLVEFLLHRGVETTHTHASSWQQWVEDGLPQDEGEAGNARALALGWISSLPEYQRATVAAHLMLAEEASLEERMHRLIPIRSNFLPAHANGTAAHPMRAARKFWIQSELTRLASAEERRQIARLVRVVGADHGRTAVLLRLHDDREVLAVVESRADSRKRRTEKLNPSAPGGENSLLMGASGLRQRPELGFYEWTAHPADAQNLVNAALRADHPDHSRPVAPMSAIAARSGGDRSDRSDRKGGSFR